MATVRNPSSLAARKMRMAISLRLAARSLRIGLVFFISEATNASREILHCFMMTTRLSCSLFDLQHRLFKWAERRGGPRHYICLTYGALGSSGMAGCAKSAGPEVTTPAFNCCSWVVTVAAA